MTNRVRLLNRLDFGLVMTLALCAFTLWPLLYRPGLPNGTDVLYHVYRVAEMDRSWSHGVPFPRWAESFYTGYGAPLFMYYASLSYYVTSLLIRLFTLDPVNVLRLLIAICMLGGGAGMYLFIKPRVGKLGGVIAALAYTYSPYILFTEPYARGAYPEMCALALLPVIFWRYDGLLRRGGPFALMTAALSSAALIITHNLMALVLTGLLFGWLVWELFVYLITVGRKGIHPYLLGLLAAGLGIGLTAYFWIPGILEADAVRLGNLTAVAQLDYRNFFVPLTKLLAFSPRPDEGAVNGLLHQLNLGVAQWALALLGLVALAISFQRSAISRQPSASDTHLSSLSTRHSALSTLYFTLAGGVCILLMLPVAAIIWGPVAPLAFLQFPWRFLGPAAFCLAVLAGLNAHWIERLPARIRSVIIVLLIIAIIGLALPTLYAPEWTHPTVDASVAAYHDAESRGLQRATTFSNEYLPKTVLVEPDPTPRLLKDYADGYPIDKVHRDALPKDVTVEVLDHGPQHNAWQVSAPAPFTLEVLTYDFPGWRAEVDGQPAPITPSDPHGLITFPIPAGEHAVRLTLGSTPARDLANAVSWLTLAVLVIISGVVYYLTPRPSLQPGGSASPLRAQHPSTGFVAASYPIPHTSSRLGTALLIGGLLTLILILVAMRPGGAWLHSPPGTALPAQNPVRYTLGDSIQFLGYDLNSRTFRPGERLELSLYWYMQAPIPYGYASFVHVSMGGPPLAQADKQNPAGRPTKEWTAAGYYRDDYAIDLPTTLPPGEYQLLVGLYTCDTLPAGQCGNGDRLSVFDADGNRVGDALPLGKVTVR